MKINVRDTEDGKSKQVVIEQITPEGIDTERIERSTNPDRAVNRALPVINSMVRNALIVGKTVHLTVE